MQILMTKPMVTAISSKSDFMFRNASGYKASNTLCLASASTWLYFDTYMKPFADDPITVCTVKAGMQEKSSFRMPEASKESPGDLRMDSRSSQFLPK